MNTAPNNAPSNAAHTAHAARAGAGTLGEKSQTKVFSTIVKALSLLIIFAFFLPFAYVSCMPVFNETISGVSLAFGGTADRVAALSEGNMGMGMGMGAGQLAALNMLAGVNLLLAIAFIGTGVLLVASFLMGRTRLELVLSLIVSAFSLAAYLQWLGIFSAFADMFAVAAAQGSMMSAGPSFGLYAAIAFSGLLLIAGTLEALGKLPQFLTKGEREQVPASPAANATVSVAATPGAGIGASVGASASASAQQPAGYYYVPNQPPAEQPPTQQPAQMEAQQSASQAQAAMPAPQTTAPTQAPSTEHPTSGTEQPSNTGNFTA